MWIQIITNIFGSSGKLTTQERIEMDCGRSLGRF